MSKKIALFSDIHLGLYKDDDTWLQSSENWVDYFIEECNKLEIKSVFFLGDWFHYRDEISVKTLDFSSKLMKKLSKNFEQVFLIVGNHDCYHKETSEIHSLTPFKEWSNITVVDKVYETCVYGKDVVFVPWGDDVPTKSYDYIFGHFEIFNFYFNKAKKCEKGQNHTELLNKGKCVYTGHFHLRQEKEYKKGKVTYIGSPFQHDFNDVGNDNGFYVIDMETDTSEFIKNPKGRFPTFNRFFISNLGDIKSVKDDLQNSYIKIVIDSEIKDTALEKLKIKLFNTFKIKDLQYDFKESLKTIDNLNISDSIDEIDILDSIEEFTKTLKLKYEDEIIKRIKEKVNKYE